MPTTPEALASGLEAALAEVGDDSGPGLALGVRLEGETLLAGCVGRADLATGRPLRASSLLGVASLTKPLTALLALRAAHDGRLDLRRAVPELGGRGTSLAAPTLAQLLTHTSGVANYVTRPCFAELKANPKVTLDDVLAAVVELEPDFAPGTRYGYSNSGYRLVERALERAYDAPFAEAVRDGVLTPLGMTGARVLRGDDAPTALATGYARSGGGWTTSRLSSWELAGAAGAAACSLQDWLALDDALFDAPALPGAVTAPMSTAVRLASGRTEGIGSGWVLSTWGDAPVVAFAGGVPGYSATYARVLPRRASVTILSNRGGEDLTGLLRAVVERLVGPPSWPAAPAAGGLDERWAGTYRDTLRSVTLRRERDVWSLDEGPRHRRLVGAGPLALRDADDPGFRVRLHDERPRALTVSWPFSWFTGYAGPGGDLAPR